MDDKGAQWITKDAIRELESEKVQERVKTKYIKDKDLKLHFK